MRCILFWLLILLYGCNSPKEPDSDSQTADIDSLSVPTNQLQSLGKYSYDLYGFKKLPSGLLPENGTCFFIKRNNRMFLVTAKHCVTGCFQGKTKPNYPDTMYIMLKEKMWIPVDIRGIKQTESCDSIENDPEIKVVEITDPRIYTVNSLEDFIDTSVSLHSSGMHLFGFPMESHPAGVLLPYVPVSHLSFSVNEITIKENLTIENKFDSLNYRVYLKTPAFEKNNLGYSGSPVLFTDATKNKSTVAGVYSGNTKNRGRNYMTFNVVKIKHVIQKIDSLIQSH